MIQEIKKSTADYILGNSAKQINSQGGVSMLLRYIVRNFKSIGYPIEFAMFPTKGNNDNHSLKTIATRVGEWKVLQRSALFGSNTSGKASFVESIDFARNYIVSKPQNEQDAGIKRFRQAPERLDKISAFQFMLYLDKEVYEYGFSLDCRQISEEWLLQLKEDDFQFLYTRMTNEDSGTIIDVDAQFQRINPQIQTLADTFEYDIPKNQLFLQKMHENGIEPANRIVSWFERLQIICPDETSQTRATQISLNAESDLEQTLFVARDANLIADFQQDEIWFVGKNQLGKTTLKPLSDFGVKKGRDVLKAYLCGRYGVTPEKSQTL